MHWLPHILGIDTQTSYFYAAYSGIIPCTLVFSAVGGWWLHKNCHVKGCWRPGKFEHEHYKLCKLHHPHTPDGDITPEIVRQTGKRA